jgi:hypothetical protein
MQDIELWCVREGVFTAADAVEHGLAARNIQKTSRISLEKEAVGIPTASLLFCPFLRLAIRAPIKARPDGFSGTEASARASFTKFLSMPISKSVGAPEIGGVFATPPNGLLALERLRHVAGLGLGGHDLAESLSQRANGSHSNGLRLWYGETRLHSPIVTRRHRRRPGVRLRSCWRLAI